MSVLSALDATWICARSHTRAVPVASPPRREPLAAETGGFSLWSLARNPHALLLTGAVGALAVKDAVAGLLAAR